MQVVKVKDITIGEGRPKICVPLVGRSVEELVAEAQYINALAIDVVEWRVDFFEKVDQLASVSEALASIRAIIQDVPLIFTFRTAQEGGEREISVSDYVALNKTIIRTGLIDLVDVELFLDKTAVKELIDEAHQHQVFVIVSNHDFTKTPDKEEIVSRLKQAQAIGADIPKIAVMPRNRTDVLTLLDATLTMHQQFADRPIITMSMAGQGVISRLAGEVFGSAITFAAAKKASAPGQVSVDDLRHSLELLHQGFVG
ncbi:type I 3-dehydroquinate dehydratase [Aquibacillus salsiterrae]|uniref:3-dehydroquinate dehydratase n=1 Tax=Aquibacillus salsiterrae TaxID=2950439 RepID=A0A9X3WD26_9BACI|nr:type I 3-dehydroquinate dehydratase [Aquibacillus salsiterrae]MDC3416196.1 type I 3-dehydroquinate dehydratase [Aquibacillus salsiterrae]